MNPKGKNIHKVLKYLYLSEKDGFESGEIAKNLDLPLGKVNEVCRFLINKGEIHDASTNDTPERNISILVKEATYDAYETKKYLRGESRVSRFIKTYWWYFVMPLIIGLIVGIIQLLIEYGWIK